MSRAFRVKGLNALTRRGRRMHLSYATEKSYRSWAQSYIRALPKYPTAWPREKSGRGFPHWPCAAGCGGGDAESGAEPLLFGHAGIERDTGRREDFEIQTQQSGLLLPAVGRRFFAQDQVSGTGHEFYELPVALRDERSADLLRQFTGALGGTCCVSNPSRGTLPRFLRGSGQRWIRTIEGVSQRIYSPPRLATSVSTRFR